MNKTYKLLRAFIKASGYEIEEVQDQYSGEVIDYKVTKKVEHYEFTKHMIENIIGVLEGHDNGDVHILINNLESMIN